MRLNLDELRYRIRTDHNFKRRLRKLILIGGIVAVIIAITVVVGIVMFSSAIISFLFANAPGLYEIGFNYVRDFASSFMLEDLTAILNPLTGSTNANEMKTLVDQYFNQLSSNPSINFQNFQSFIATVKNSLLDNQVTTTELELVRKFLIN